MIKPPKSIRIKMNSCFTAKPELCAPIFRQLLDWVFEDPAQRLDRLEVFATECIRSILFLKEKGDHLKELMREEFPLRLESSGWWTTLLLDLQKSDLERMSADADKISDSVVNPPPPWIEFIETMFYPWLATSTEKSINWALVLLRLASRVNEQGERKEEPTPSYLFAIDQILRAAVIPPTQYLPEKRWLERIIQGIPQDGSLQELFDDLVGVLTEAVGRTRNNQLPILEYADSNEKEDRRRWEGFTGTVDLADRFRKTGIHLNMAEVRCLRANTPAVAARIQKRELRATTARALYHAKHDEIERIMTDQLREIREEPRRLLAPGGGDAIDVEDPLLRDFGLRRVVLQDTEGSYPNIRLTFFVREFTPHLVRTELDLDTFLRENIGLFMKRELEPEISLFLIRAFIVDLFHRIVVRYDDFSQNSGDSANNVDARKILLRRAHRRELPSGYTPSPYALANAAEAKFPPLPPGYTFVKAKWSEEVGFAHDLGDQKPFLVYGTKHLPAHLR